MRLLVYSDYTVAVILLLILLVLLSYKILMVVLIIAIVRLMERGIIGVEQAPVFQSDAGRFRRLQMIGRKLLGS